MNANPSQTVDPSRIEISNHCEYRAVHRLGVVERTRGYIRDLLADARVEETEDVENAEAWRVGDVVIVVDPDDQVAVTLFERPEGGR